MTLWEAIRQLKEGQEIVGVVTEEGRALVQVAIWFHGEDKPRVSPDNFRSVAIESDECEIHDLPRPATLYDALVEGAKKEGIIITCHTCPLAGSDCDPRIDCHKELAKALQSIALAAGFDLKKVVK